ncbi:MAG: cyclodeaminase/cyclohydrolase family protein [Thermoplasmata archaeon]|nr:cyclodeaminase/cyclohydrolase family protein [Thermoplasmata archaeon]RLF25458.1 MAG: methenyltetrahydrofolate cyclohydrolase [Thermoplasmata archaeon]
MKKLVDMDIKSFLDEVASESPAPGGGSVAALAGALGAALSAMVCNLTLNKEKYASVHDEIEEVLERCEHTRDRLLDIVDKDTEAFNRVMDALKLPKTTEEEKRIRKNKLQEAFKGAALVPLETARLCAEIIEVTKTVAQKGNQSSITDAVVSALMAEAGFKAAILNVKINLASIKDKRFVEDMEYEIELMERNTEDGSREVMDFVNSTF